MEVDCVPAIYKLAVGTYLVVLCSCIRLISILEIQSDTPSRGVSARGSKWHIKFKLSPEKTCTIETGKPDGLQIT